MVLPTLEICDNFLQNSVIQLPIFTFYVDTSKNESDIFQHTKEYINVQNKVHCPLLNASSSIHCSQNPSHKNISAVTGCV